MNFSSPPCFNPILSIIFIFTSFIVPAMASVPALSVVNILASLFSNDIILLWLSRSDLKLCVNFVVMRASTHLNAGTCSALSNLLYPNAALFGNLLAASKLDRVINENICLFMLLLFRGFGKGKKRRYQKRF